MSKKNVISKATITVIDWLDDEGLTRLSAEISFEPDLPDCYKEATDAQMVTLDALRMLCGKNPEIEVTEPFWILDNWEDAE